MSGGIGPPSDIHLPKEEKFTKPVAPTPSPRPTFTFTQLNALAIILIFAASGLVAIEDFVFAVFSLFYIYFLSKVAFPNLSPRADPPVFGKSRVLNLYVMVGALIGLILPIVYIFEGIYEGDKEGIKAAAPHVFLLASQIFMEGVTFTRRFSLPVRGFIPVFYNTRRIFAILDWLNIEMAKKVPEEHGSLRRLQIGRALAVANLAFWCFNLFGFLVPVYLPKAFNRYYGQKVKD